MGHLGPLGRGRADDCLDAIFGDARGSHAWLEGLDGAGFEFAGAGYRLDEGIGIAVLKDDEGLRRRLNRVRGCRS